MEGKTVDFAALDLLCDKLECGDASHRATAAQIRKAMNGVERSNDGVDVDALLKLADHLNKRMSYDPKGDNLLADTIRNAVNGAKPQLPEGIGWPRFEDGEMVKFGDVAKVREDIGEVIEIRFHTGKCSEVTIAFEGESTATHYMVIDGPHVKRPEPEVLDADGVPIKVGDTVWNISTGKKYEVLKLPRKGSYQSVMVRGEDGADGFDPDRLTHRKPDTQEAIDDDLTLPPWEYCERHGIGIESGSDEATTVEAMCRHLIERQRKLMGGE